MPTTTAWAMAKRVLASALVGVLAGAIFIIPISLLFQRQRHVTGDAGSFHMSLPHAIGVWLLDTPLMAILGAIVASPLIFIAVATGIAFRRSIDRRPLLWASLAPVSVWLFTCAVFASKDDRPSWGPHLDFKQLLLLEMGKIDNSLFFFAPAAAGLCFVLLTRRAARRASARALYAPPPTR